MTMQNENHICSTFNIRLKKYHLNRCPVPGQTQIQPHLTFSRAGQLNWNTGNACKIITVHIPDFFGNRNYKPKALLDNQPDCEKNKYYNQIPFSFFRQKAFKCKLLVHVWVPQWRKVCNTFSAARVLAAECTERLLQAATMNNY